MGKHSSPSSPDEDLSGESSGEEERRRSKDRRKERDHKRSSSSASKKKKSTDKKESKKERKKRKRRHHSDDSEGSSGDEDDKRKKQRLLKEAKDILKRHKHSRDRSNGDNDRDTKPKSASHKALSEEDYYEKNKEFSTWLKEERSVFFSSLSADDTRRLFVDFVEAWNSGKLSRKYYEGIDFAARSGHKWQIRGEKEFAVDREEEQEFLKKLEKAQRKRFHREREELMDELLPKATGKDRLLEKKAIRREEARFREDSPELLRERDIMGGGDDFKQRLERERARKEKRQMERSEALKEKQLAFDAKEAAAMDQLKALVNVAGGKITIPKR